MDSPIDLPDHQPVTDGGSSPKATPPAWRSWVIAGVVAALVAGGAAFFVSRNGGSGTASAGATTNAATANGSNTDAGNGRGFGRFGARGEIKAIDGTTLTIETTNPQDGSTSSVEVKTTGDTTFTESAKGALTDVAVGDNVLVIKGDDGATVTSLVDNGDQAGGFAGGTGGTPPDLSNGTPPSFPGGTPPSFPGGTPPSFPANGNGGPQGPGRGRGAITAGKVTAVDGSSVTIAAQDGTTTTVTIPDTATVTVTRSITLADLAVGDSITATPSDSSDTTDDGSITARSVRKGDAGIGGPGGFGFPGRASTASS